MFDSIATDGAVKIEWSMLADIWLAVGAPKYSQWLRERRLVPMPNLKGAYLEGAYLNGANLNGANLNGANLNRADLEGAYLVRANLEGANLDRAYLNRADLEGAYLDRAYLKGANLEGARRSTSDPIPDGWKATPMSCSCCVTLKRK